MRPNQNGLKKAFKIALVGAVCSCSGSGDPSDGRIELYFPDTEGGNAVAKLSEFRLGMSSIGFFRAPQIVDVVTSENVEVLSVGSPGVNTSILLKTTDAVGPARVEVVAESDGVRVFDEIAFDVVRAYLVPDSGACFGATALTTGRHGFRYSLQSEAFNVAGDASDSLSATDEDGTPIRLDFHSGLGMHNVSFDVPGNRVDVEAPRYDFSESLEFVRTDAVTRFELARVDSYVDDLFFESPEAEELVAQTRASFAFHGGSGRLCLPVPDPSPGDGQMSAHFVEATLVDGDCQSFGDGAAGLSFENAGEADCTFSVRMPDRPDLGEIEVVAPAAATIQFEDN